MSEEPEEEEVVIYQVLPVVEEVAAEEEGECLAAEANGEGGKSDEGTSAVNVESNMDAEAAEAIEDGSF